MPTLKALLVAMPMCPETINWPPALLSVGSLAAYARADPWTAAHADVDILSYVVDLPTKDYRDDEEILQIILLKKPDVVGFSCYIWNIERIRHITQLLKAVAPHITIVWGGPEVGFTPDAVLRASPGVDVVVRGEGERTFVDLLKAVGGEPGHLSLVAGIAYREGGAIVLTPERAPLNRLDDIPSPHLTGIVSPQSGPKGGHVALESFRSCPYRCGFCVSPGKPRFFSIDRLRRELEYCFDRDVESFLFVDPYINIQKSRLAAIADILEAIDPKQRKMSACFVMAERLDEESVSALRRMNVPMAKTGLQSTNPDVLKNIDLRLNRERFRAAIRLLKDAGIVVHLQLIAGLPGDTLDGLRRSFDFAFELAPACISCYTPLLLPGSALDRRRDALGIVHDERAPHRILSHCSLSYDQMLECLEFAYDACQQYNGLSRSEQEHIQIDTEAWESRSHGTDRMRHFFTGA